MWVGRGGTGRVREAAEESARDWVMDGLIGFVRTTDFIRREAFGWFRPGNTV